MTSAAATWFRARLPTRETLAANRFFSPFAHHLLRSDLWRFNRRSVPRGVALGLFVGVMIPLAHFVVAAFLAIFIRANIPAALAATFIGFPLFYIAIVALAYRVGEWLLHLDSLTPLQPLNGTMQATQTDHLLERMTGAGLETAFGLLVIATLLASVGYFVTGFFWRLWIARKRRARLAEARALRAAPATE